MTLLFNDDVHVPSPRRRPDTRHLRLGAFTFRLVRSALA